MDDPKNPAAAAAALQPIPNDTNALVRFEVPEVTSLCPVTGQPDFAVFRVWAHLDAHTVELKSLKQYFWSFRNHGEYHEALTARAFDDLWRVLRPKGLLVEGDFYVRGGIHTCVHKHGGVLPDGLVLARLNHFAYRAHG